MIKENSSSNETSLFDEVKKVFDRLKNHINTNEFLKNSIVLLNSLKIWMVYIKYKLATWNCNSVSNNHTELSNFLNVYNIDKMAFNETKINPCNILFMKGFQVVRKDRPEESRFGGVAILIKNDIIFYNPSNK